MQKHWRSILKIAFIGCLASCQVATPGPIPIPDSADGGFTFAVAADTRYFAGAGEYDSTRYFRGAAETMAGLGGIAFLVSPGDMDPLEKVRWTLDQTLGADFRWLPVVGNHELPGLGTEAQNGANMAYLRAYSQGKVNPGPPACPETTFSFDDSNAHFAVLNEYCDTAGDTAGDGDISDYLYTWLAADLAAAKQEHIFVIGHEPAYPQPDEQTGVARHVGESLDKHAAHRDRFWALLQAEDVTAYLCGHTHKYSAVQIDGVWQIDTGHARGIGDPEAPSTLVLIRVSGATVSLQAYRDDMHGGAYTPRSESLLEGAAQVFLPLVNR